MAFLKYYIITTNTVAGILSLKAILKGLVLVNYIRHKLNTAAFVLD